ncbi:MAG: sulfotransferase, partial [Acidobacteriota bacterium]
MSDQRIVRYQRPVQRAPVRIFNLVAGSLGRFGQADLSETGLFATARARAELEDFDEDGFREPLRVLLHSLAGEANLHPFGLLYARQLILRCLVNRLRLTEHWKRAPEILHEEVRAPLFVLGLPRTGTTLLLNLLASDPANRWLAFWEAHEPSPPPERASYQTDPRRRRARREVRTLDYLVPGLIAMHEISAEGPEECFALLANSFAGIQFSWMFDVPAFNEWLSAHDARSAYAYHRKQLQLLQWHCPGERWVLKSPGHLWTIDALVATFPDARIVQLHRDPLKVVPSACSLGATMRALTAAKVDVYALGKSAT